MCEENKLSNKKSLILIKIWIKSNKNYTYPTVYFIMEFFICFFRISRRLGLKSKSFGKKTDRFITISRRFSGKDIIRQLLAKGGSNEKYELVSPNSN